MKYLINYGSGAAVFPEKALDIITRAGANDLRVLLYICSVKGNFDIKKLSSKVGCTEEEARESLSFWRGAGIIDLSEKNAAAEVLQDQAPTEKVAEQPEKKESLHEEKKLRREDELPHYTSDELANILEERKETATLIDESQNIMGKVFNVKEINVLMGLLDYLGLDCEYIMILLTYCVSIGKKTLHYAEKTAFALYDAGITTSAQLAEELKRREASADAETKIRSLFGVGERAFTTKEKRFISVWINDMNFSVEIIEKAYEVTADATGKGSFAYANSVLERWYAEGLRSIEQIEQSYKKNDGQKPAQGSFDTDSFFEAAVKRSLGGS